MPPSLTPQILDAARILWNYLKLDQQPEKSDCLIAMGSHDLRVAEHAAQLTLAGWAPVLVCSGGLGRLTRAIWHEPEARQFAKIAMRAGVPAGQILIEDQSANTGENMRFSKELLSSHDMNVRRALLVHKPYMERRALATALKVWPEIEYCVSSPSLSFDEYPTEGISRNQVIHIMVGDFQRILEYPSLGYQVPQEIPEDVMQAYQKLVEVGYSDQALSI